MIKQNLEEVEQYFKAYLQSVYNCKVDYTIEASRRNTQLVGGHYKSSCKKIKIYRIGHCPLHILKYVALHELAHHIHYTEFNKEQRKEKTHGKEFYAILEVLIKNRANN